MVLGEDPSKTPLVGSQPAESSTNPGLLPAACGASEPPAQMTTQPTAPMAQNTTTSVVKVAPAEDMSGDGKP